MILHPANNVDTLKNVTVNEGKHEEPLKTTAKGKKGSPIPKGGVSLNKLYGLHNSYQDPRNNRTNKTTTM